MCIIKVLPKFRTQLLTNKGEKNNKAGRGWGWGSMGDKNQMVIDHRKSKKNKKKGKRYKQRWTNPKAVIDPTERAEDRVRCSETQLSRL